MKIWKKSKKISGNYSVVLTEPTNRYRSHGCLSPAWGLMKKIKLNWYFHITTILSENKFTYNTKPPKYQSEFHVLPIISQTDKQLFLSITTDGSFYHVPLKYDFITYHGSTILSIATEVWFILLTTEGTFSITFPASTSANLFLTLA